MTYSLSLRPRALVEIEAAHSSYDLVEHGSAFLTELATVLDAIAAMPLRFPVVHGVIHRALLRGYPFAVFFRIRAGTNHIVILAVAPQRADPTRWPKK